MTKSTEDPQGDEPAHIVAYSLVEKDLTVSWDTVGSEYDWYRVESVCTPVECISMGVESDKCPSMTVVSTVVARNLEELCESLAFPKINAPMSAKILSVQRYSRSYLKQNNQPDQCNVLEDVEFCQIPECQDFCIDTSSSLIGPQAWLGHLIHDQEPRRGFWRNGGYPAANLRPKKATVNNGASKKAVGFFSSLESESFLYEGHGSVGLSGFSYVVSPFWSFEGSGSIRASGSLFLSFEHESQGSVHLSGSASDLKMSIELLGSGSIVVFGHSRSASPSYNLSASGGFYLYGSAKSPMLAGVFDVRFEASVSAFDMGYEYLDDLRPSPISISDFTVSACGCQSIGPIVLLRHNLQRSEIFHRFVSSENISFPDQMPMRYREEDNSWRFYQSMTGRSGSLSVSSSLACSTDSWRLDFGVNDELKRTRISLDMPFDMVCSGVMNPLSMIFYFSSFSSEDGSGQRIPAVNPVKSKSIRVYGKVDSFVDGVFVPETVYYDEVGLFSDSYWSYAPFELRINPPANKLTKTVKLDWVI